MIIIKCPKCGAYSPYNTSVCNRCHAKLTGGKDQKTFRRHKYLYLRKGQLSVIGEKIVAFADRLADKIKADKTLRIIALSVISIIAAALLVGFSLSISCGFKALGGCSGCVPPRSDVSETNITTPSVTESDVSETDASASDINASESDVSDA